MKRNIVVLVVIFILLVLFSSCDVTFMEEGRSVNEYIFPYVDFTLSEDGTYYIASITAGAPLSKVYIPAYVDDYIGSIPVKYFTGFENDEDIINLKSTVFESSNTIIKLKSLDQAAILETIHYEKINSSSNVWKNLPILPHTGEYEFVGWFTTDTDEEVRNGDEINPEHTTIYAKRLKVEVIHHVEVEATCTKSGVAEYWECRNCGLLFSDSDCKNQITQTVVPSLGHATVYMEEIAPSCTETGLKAHYECARCHSLFTDEKAKKETTKASLEISALGHNWERQNLADTTCTWDECTRCHETKDPVGHSWNEGVVTKVATENEHGTMLFTCTVCRYTKTEDIAPLDKTTHVHTWVDSTPVAPGCTTRGYTVRTCSGCGISYEYNYVDAIGHKMTYVSAKSASCTENGNSAYYSCSACGELYSDRSGINKTTLEAVQDGRKATGHKYSSSVYEIDKNYHWHVCSVCGVEISGTRSSHSFTEETTKYPPYKEADCTHPALYYLRCICGEENGRTFEYGKPKGHDPEKIEAKEATCGENGNKEYWVCKICRDKFFDESCTQKIEFDEEVDDASGEHTFEKYISIGPDGHQSLCSVCRQQYGEILSHNIETINWKEDENNHWKQCKNCDYKTDEGSHSYKKYGTDDVCEVCLHVKDGSEKTSQGGFDIKPEINEPEGLLKVVGSNGSFTATFTLNEDSKMTSVIWILEDREISGNTNTTSSTCRFSAPERRTYHIVCVVFNGTLVNSFEQTVVGGGTT